MTSSNHILSHSILNFLTHIRVDWMRNVANSPSGVRLLGIATNKPEFLPSSHGLQMLHHVMETRAFILPSVCIFQVLHLSLSCSEPPSISFILIRSFGQYFLKENYYSLTLPINSISTFTSLGKRATLNNTATQVDICRNNLHRFH